MVEVELAKKHSVEEIAESLYNAFAKATCCVAKIETAPPPFAHLSLEDQQVFFVLARQGPAVLQQMEHQPLRDVARQVYQEAGPGRVGGESWESLIPVWRLLWEMAARHLAILLDCDEAPTLAEVETVVVEWFEKKLPVALS